MPSSDHSAGVGVVALSIIAKRRLEFARRNGVFEFGWALSQIHSPSWRRTQSKNDDGRRRHDEQFTREH